MPLLLIDTELCESLRLTINQYLILQTLNNKKETEQFKTITDWNINDLEALENKAYIIKSNQVSKKIEDNYVINPNILTILNNWIDEFTKLYISYPSYKKGKIDQTIPLKGNKDKCHKKYLELTKSNIKLQKALAQHAKEYINANEGTEYILTLLGYLNSLDIDFIIQYANEMNIEKKKEIIL